MDGNYYRILTKKISHNISNVKTHLLNLNDDKNKTFDDNKIQDKRFTKRYSQIIPNIDILNRESQLKILNLEKNSIENGLKAFIKKNQDKISQNDLSFIYEKEDSEKDEKLHDTHKKGIIKKNNKHIDLDSENNIHQFKIDNNEILKKQNIKKNVNLIKKKKSNIQLKSKVYNEDFISKSIFNNSKKSLSVINKKGKLLLKESSINPKRKTTEILYLPKDKKKSKKLISLLDSQKYMKKKKPLIFKTNLPVKKIYPFASKVIKKNFQYKKSDNTLKKRLKLPSLIILQNKKDELNCDELFFIMKHSEKLKLEKTLKNSYIMNKDFKMYKNKEIFRILQRTKKVCDSINDDEDEIEEGENEYFIHPKSYFKYYWDFFIFIIILFTLIFLPLQICFFINHFSCFFIDVIYLIDLISNFFMAYYDKEETLIVNHKTIIIHYIFGWFIVDLISFIPFNSLKYLNILSIDFYCICLLRLIKYFKIFHCSNFYYLKVLKKIFFFNKKVKSCFKNFSFNYKGVINLLKNIFRIIIILHILSCVWIYIKLINLESYIKINDIHKSEYFNLYLSSLYFNFVSIFTVGYGDILPSSHFERQYSLLLLIFSLIINTYAVSFLENLVDLENSKNLKLMNKIQYLQNISVLYNVNYELYEKILNFLKYNSKFNAEEKEKFIDYLPTSLKNTLICTMYKEIIENFTFFKQHRDNNTEFKVRVLLSLRPIIAFKGEEIVKIGQFVDEIIFVKSGRISIFFYYNKMIIRLLFLRKYEHFGESLVLQHKRSPVGLKIYSNGVSELLLLRRDDFIKILSDYNENFKTLLKKSEGNLIRIKKIIKKKKNQIKNILKEEMEYDKFSKKSYSSTLEVINENENELLFNSLVKNKEDRIKKKNDNIKNNLTNHYSLISIENEKKNNIGKNLNITLNMRHNSSMSANVPNQNVYINLNSNGNNNVFDKLHQIKVTINNDGINNSDNLIEKPLLAPRDKNKLTLNYKNNSDKKIKVSPIYNHKNDNHKKENEKKITISNSLTPYIKMDKNNKKNKKSIFSLLDEQDINFLDLEKNVGKNLFTQIKEKVDDIEGNIKIEKRLNNIAKKYFNIQFEHDN